MPETQLPELFISSARHTLTEGLRKIEHCVGQLTDDQFWWRPDACKNPEMNSVANLLLHLSGNIRQWLVSGVGGTKDTRNRPLEFSDRSNRPKSEILLQFQSTIKEADAALAAQLPLLRGEGQGEGAGAALTAPRRIQGQDTNVTAAILKCITHLHGHVQEIIHMTRSLLGDRYRFDFVPKGPEQTSANK
jgi:Protein of unknown function (DUF1572)